MAAVQKGKSYKRRVKAHTLGMEAMFRFMAVIRTMVARQTRPPRQCKSYNVSTRQTIQVCRESVANSEDLQEVLPDLCQNLSSVQILFSAFKNDAAAKFSVFAFWNSYFDMIGLLLAFILAERNGDWLSHLSAVAAERCPISMQWTEQIMLGGCQFTWHTWMNFHQRIANSSKNSSEEITHSFSPPKCPILCRVGR